MNKIRVIQAVCLAVLCALSASAESPEAAASSRLLEKSWSEAPRFSSTLSARDLWMDAPGCWTRPISGAGAPAQMGLAEKVCIQRVGVRIAPLHDLPFGYGGGMLIDGAPYTGTFWISGGVRLADGWLLIGSIWHGEGAPNACGVPNKVGLVVEFQIDGKSTPVPGTLNVRGYAYNYADYKTRCEQKTPQVEIPYTR